MRFKNRPSDPSVRICLEILTTFWNSSSQSMPSSSSSGLIVVSKRGSFRWHEWSNIMRFQETDRQKSGWKAPWAFFSATGICPTQVHQGKSNTCSLFSYDKRKKGTFTGRLLSLQNKILFYVEPMSGGNCHWQLSLLWLVNGLHYDTILCWIHFTCLLIIQKFNFYKPKGVKIWSLKPVKVTCTHRYFRLVSIANFQTSPGSSQKLSSAGIENISHFCSHHARESFRWWNILLNWTPETHPTHTDTLTPHYC